MAKQVILKLSQEQARIVWGILDGAADAGACDDGLTEHEQEAIQVAVVQIIEQRDSEAWKRGLIKHKKEQGDG